MNRSDYQLRKEEQKIRRAKRLEKRTNQLLEMQYESENYLIVQKSKDSYMINGFLMVFLLHNKYRNVKSGETGSFNDIKKFVKLYIAKYRNAVYFTDENKAPKLPRFLFVSLRPGLKKFLSEYRKYSGKNSTKSVITNNDK